MAKILIVDDKPLNRSVLTTLLGYKGHHALEASSGVEALQQMELENPGLKANYDLMLVPIIVVSARDPMLNEQRALDAGAEAFIQKPFDADELFAAIQRALLKSGQEVSGN